MGYILISIKGEHLITWKF